MPEVQFQVRWPDGGRARYYSPSRAIRSHLIQGQRYPTDEFVQRVMTAMDEASERVRQKFGFYCSSAADTSARVRARAEALSGVDRQGEVEVEHIDDPSAG